MAEGGGLIFTFQEPGVYQVHTNFLPLFRGAHALAAIRGALRWMFTHTDAMVVYTQVPAFNDAARRAAQAVGGVLDFERHAAWPTANGMVAISYWSLSYETWMRGAGAFEERGRWFHDRIEAEFARHAAPRAEHPDEECHDRYVGACIETILGGQVEKAIILYNRWARFAGYGVIGLVAKAPLILDIGDAVVQVVDDDLKVLKCR